MDLTSFILPIIIASIGLLGPIVKTVLERRKSDAEAQQIYESIEIANAKAALETIASLRAEVKRLEKLLKKHRISPLETGPLDDSNHIKKE